MVANSTAMQHILEATQEETKASHARFDRGNEEGQSFHENHCHPWHGVPSRNVICGLHPYTLQFQL
jgi:hypothetical protein